MAIANALLFALGATQMENYLIFYLHFILHLKDKWFS